MKLVLSTLVILVLSGCSSKEHICPPQKPCLFPVFKTYKQPKTIKLTKPVILDNGNCIVPYSEWKVVYLNNKYREGQLDRCNLTLIRSNESYKLKEDK